MTDFRQPDHALAERNRAARIARPACSACGQRGLDLDAGLCADCEWWRQEWLDERADDAERSAPMVRQYRE